MDTRQLRRHANATRPPAPTGSDCGDVRDNEATLAYVIMVIIAHSGYSQVNTRYMFYYDQHLFSGLLAASRDVGTGLMATL